MNGYRNVVYDIKKKEVIVYTWDDDGKRLDFSVDFRPYLYVEDNKGEDGVSVFGTKLKKVSFKDLFERMKYVEEKKLTRLFENLRPEQQVLLDMFSEHVDDPEFSKFPLKIAYLDIEAVDANEFSSPEDAKTPINVITVYDSYNKIYNVWGLKPFHTEDKDVVYKHIPNEEDLLFDFINYMEKERFDVVTGWNIQGYDIPYLINRICNILPEGSANRLSTIDSIYTREIMSKFGKKQIIYKIDGLAVVDYMDIYKKFCLTNRESYKLDYIASVELKENKLDYGDRSLFEFMRDDWNTFVEYNIHDVRLIVKLEEQLMYIDLLRMIAYMGCGTLDMALATVSIVMGCAAIKARKQKQIINTFVRDSQRNNPGGFVFPPVTGHHEGIVTFDANSLYPNIMISLNMSPETKFGAITSKDDNFVTIKHVNGKHYKLTHENFKKFLIENKIAVSKADILFTQNKKGIMCDLVDENYKKRVQIQKNFKKLKKQLDSGEVENAEQVKIECNRLKTKQQAIKIFINSVYGVFGNRKAPIGDDDIAASITLTGQSVIQKSKDIIQEYFVKRVGNDVEDCFLYGDSDSCFITVKQLPVKVFNGNKVTKEGYAEIDKINDYLNLGIASFMKDELNSIDSRIEFKRDKISDKGIMLSKKRYALHVLDEEGLPCDDWKYTGIDLVNTRMPKEIKPYVEKVIQTMIITKSKTLTNNAFKDVYDKFLDMGVEMISLTSGIKNLEQYSNRCDGNITVKGMPCHVKAAYFYNKIIKELKIDNKYETIFSGDKIKYFYVNTPNTYNLDAIAFKNRFPKEFQELFEMDLEKMFDKDVYQCIERFYKIMNWEIYKPTSQFKVDLDELFS
jgi:DNA polymerase elongation subunit (family B)